MSARVRSPKPERVTESEFRKAVIDALNAMPGVWVHHNRIERAGRGFSMLGLGTGSPDIVGHVDFGPPHIARFFALEVKRPGGAGERSEHRARQDAWHAEHRAMGAFVARIEPALTVAEGIEMAIRAVGRCRAGGVE